MYIYYPRKVVKASLKLSIKLWEYFCAQRIQKQQLYSTISPLTLSVFNACLRKYCNVCICIPLLENKVYCIQVPHQKADSCINSTTRIRHGTLWTQKVFWQLHKIKVEPLMSHGLFEQCPYYLSRSWKCRLRCCLWLCRVRKLLDFLKNILICVLRMNIYEYMSYTYDTRVNHSWQNFHIWVKVTWHTAKYGDPYSEFVLCI